MDVNPAACIPPGMVYMMLAATLLGIGVGALLLRWFLLRSGLLERGFRSSLSTLVLFVLSVASALSLCVAIDGFWLRELILCVLTIPAFIWSVFRDRELLGPL